jgi:uncharacterized protein YbjT (DUF2867 family)
MNLTVFGATGGVGREVVTQALDAGHDVTAYVRNPSKLDVTHSNLTVITGELTDRDAVQRAVHGSDAVISALGPSLDREATGMPLIDGTRTVAHIRREIPLESHALDARGPAIERGDQVHLPPRKVGSSAFAIHHVSAPHA